MALGVNGRYAYLPNIFGIQSNWCGRVNKSTLKTNGFVLAKIGAPVKAACDLGLQRRYRPQTGTFHLRKSLAYAAA